MNESEATLVDDELLQRAIDFHGHNCGGLLIGIRAGMAGLHLLGLRRGQDEDLVVMSDTNLCPADGLAVVTGCTVGRGTLTIRDWGKSVFYFGRHGEGRMLRLVLRPGATVRPEDAHLSGEERSKASTERMRTLPDKDLFDMTWVHVPSPEQAPNPGSDRCSQCGELVSLTHAHQRDKDVLCPQCYGAEQIRRW